MDVAQKIKSRKYVDRFAIETGGPRKTKSRNRATSQCGARFRDCFMGPHFSGENVETQTGAQCLKNSDMEKVVKNHLPAVS